MKKELNEGQRRCVDGILANMEEYLTLRYQMSTRANPRFENAWPDLQWCLMQQLRNILENDKMWGPRRYVIGEVLCSDDRQKITDIYNPSHQSSIQTEIVEKREEGKHKTADVLDIHDFRTLYAAVDPAIASIVSVMQIYMWWDLPDAVDLARFDIKMDVVKMFKEQGIPQAAFPFYAEMLKKTEGLPSADEILLYELRETKFSVDRFTQRRNAEPGYRIVIARRSQETSDNIDRLVSAIARELILLRNIESGSPLDEGLKKQFAQALRVDPDSLNPAMETDYLRGMLADHEKKLRATMTAEMTGTPFNFKGAQADAIVRKFAAISAGYDLAPPPAPQASADGSQRI